MGMLFANAHCQSPVCNPSRASAMTSLYPGTTGIYFLNPDIPSSEVAARNKLMPRRFQEEGYHVTAAGKIFHNGHGINEKHIPNYAGQFGGFGPYPEEKLTGFDGVKLWDWGVFPEKDESMPDYQIASWARNQLRLDRDSALWLGVGFYRPHVPQYAPQKWFGLYPLETLELPEYLATDLDDIPAYGVDLTSLHHVSPTHDWVLSNDQWKPIVQSYLACVSFVDEQVGRVLEMLESSSYSENTFVVLFSDHGFHLGEKDHYAKRSLWEDGTRVPLIIAGPGIEKGGVCTKPVQLLDIYPTLLELCNLEGDSLHEGNSLVPLLSDPDAEWPHMARTSFGPGNYSIRSERYRFVQYNDGSEEFYDHKTDPNEWYNRIKDPACMDLIDLHRQHIPDKAHEILGKGSTGHKAFAASEANRRSR
jgi:arylsulfatase A-like enzyme